MGLEPGRERKEEQELEGGYERDIKDSGGTTRERMYETAEEASFQEHTLCIRCVKYYFLY